MQTSRLEPYTAKKGSVMNLELLSILVCIGILSLHGVELIIRLKQQQRQAIEIKGQDLPAHDAKGEPVR